MTQGTMQYESHGKFINFGFCFNNGFNFIIIIWEIKKKVLWIFVLMNLIIFDYLINKYYNLLKYYSIKYNLI